MVGELSMSKLHKKLAYSLLSIVFVMGSVFLGFHAMSIADDNKQASNEIILGVWVEDDVARYSADTLYISPKGVYWNEDFISTQFDVNEGILTFDKGGKEQRYKYMEGKGQLVHLNGYYKAKYHKLNIGHRTAHPYSGR